MSLHTKPAFFFVYFRSEVCGHCTVRIKLCNQPAQFKINLARSSVYVNPSLGVFHRSKCRWIICISYVTQVSLSLALSFKHSQTYKSPVLPSPCSYNILFSSVTPQDILHSSHSSAPQRHLLCSKPKTLLLRASELEEGWRGDFGFHCLFF